MCIRKVKLNSEAHRGRLAALIIIATVVISVVIGYSFEKYGNEGFVQASMDKLRQIVIIDAGHGGEDSGAIGVNGVLEKDLNLIIARLVGDYLEAEGYTVVYTRTDDKLLYSADENIKGIRKISDLKNRCKIANSYEKAIFVSIHMNSFSSEKYSGLQVYYSQNSDESIMLAESVQNKTRELLQPNNNRKVKEGRGIYVLENISHPAVMVECGFLTNKEECRMLSEPNYRDKLGFVIASAICEYIGM